MQQREKIAIIGMGGLFPGSATLGQFWENLLQHKDLVSPTSTKEFGADPSVFYYDEKGTLDKCYALRGGYVRDFAFDPEGYRLPARLLAQQDPLFQWTLYVADQALAHSGYRERTPARCGAIIGNLSFPTRHSRQLLSGFYAQVGQTVGGQLLGEELPLPDHQTDYPAQHPDTLLGNAPAALLAQALGLQGPHYSLDAACASSLYAVRLACDALHTGKADLMLAGAVSAADPLFIQMGFSYFHAYARMHEVSAPLDKQSGGLTSAEGAGMVVLKRLSDAERDGDHILAVIEGVGLSNDGKGKFLLSPNPKGQKLAFGRAYTHTEVRPSDIDYLECHATGTPLGDVTELNSISEFFGQQGNVPLLGSVKSNMGHLLTAAGMTGILKVVLGMQHKQVPATIKIERPLESGKIGAAQLVRENIAWPQRGPLAHAGINAFGFGGTNAHLVLSAYEGPKPQSQPIPTLNTEQQRLAITGMDLHFGDCDSLQSFYHSLVLGKQHFHPLPPQRWKGMEQLQGVRQALGLQEGQPLQGAWLQEFDLDLKRFKIQPKEAERLTLQQTLMLKVADQALKDAGMQAQEGKAANIAVLTAMESELEIHHRMGRWDLGWQVRQALQQAGLELPEEGEEERLTTLLKDTIFPASDDHSPSEHTGFIGNIISSRISALWDFTGPSFTISSGDNAVYKALEVARNLLAMGEVEAVVLCAVDLAGSMESALNRSAQGALLQGQQPTLGWGQQGWTPGEGAGALVLKRAQDVQPQERVYAYLDGLAIGQAVASSLHGALSAQDVENAAQQALTEAGVTPEAVGLLELSASGIAAEDLPEMQGLAAVYRQQPQGLSCAIGSAKAQLGHSASASGMAALIRASLCLYHRLLPPVPAWQGPKQAEVLEGSAFFAPAYAQPWLPEKGQSVLRAAVSGLGNDGTAAHLLLSEGSHPDPEQASSLLLEGGIRLFPVGAPTPQALQARLEQLPEALERLGFAALSDALCREAEEQSQPSVAVLVAEGAEALQKEIRQFSIRLLNAASAGTFIQTPAGSYYTPAPLGRSGKVACVYPGSGSAYPGLGHSLLQLLPGLYDYLKGSVNHISDAFFAQYLYPRSLWPMDVQAQKQAEQRLQTDALPMMAIGCAFSALYTQVLQQYLGVQAQGVMGYSMGETSSMWYGQGLWDSHEVDDKFLDAPLFRTEVGGEMQLLGKLWQMPAQEAKARWNSRLLKGKAPAPYSRLEEWFRAELQPKASRVYLTFINTDSEIILSGDREELDRLLDPWPMSQVSLTINNVVHHDFCRAETPALIEMHHLPLQRAADKVFYSGVSLQPLAMESMALAENAKEVCCREVDLPRLVRKLHADGYRLFVELGANATCSRWISEILEGQPHACVPSDRKGASPLKSLYAMAAMLLAQGVPMSLRHFYSAEAPAKTQLNKRLRSGGRPFHHLPQAQPFALRKLVLAGMDEDDTPALPPIHTPDIPMIAHTPTTLPKAENGLSLQNYENGAHLQGKRVIWNEQDLLTFATGKIAEVFGKEFDIIDTYRRRVMLPMPPYLLVSRVTDLQAQPHVYKPSRITTEYDIPYNSWFSTDGQIPWAVAVESGQCDLLLISYLGIDFQNKGEYVYRLLDCTLTFLDDLPYEGQTLRYDISINNFVRNGNNLLFFFSYECFVEDRMVLKMDGGCAGFFSDEELSHGQGVVFTPSELQARRERKQQFFQPLLRCDKTSFSKEELLALTRGDLVAAFGPDYYPMGRNTSLRLPPQDILMLDRITQVDLKGGTSGLGFIEAEKDLQPQDWYFPCHFRDDEVLAGSLQAEGGGQLLRFFMLMLGMQRLTKDARFQPVMGVPQKVRCRKEVPPKAGKLVYRMDVKEVGLTPEPYVIADLEIHYGGYIAVFFENLGLRLQEKDTPTYLKDLTHCQNGIYVKPTAVPALLNEYHITQFALGPVHECFGEEYKIFEGRELSRQPNTDLQFISRVLEVKGERHTFNNKPEILAEYDVPADAWYFEQNASPVMPYSVLMEVALQPCGFLGAYLGSTLSVPDRDLFFRNLDGDGEMLREVDLRGKTVLNRSVMESHTRLGGTVLQRYRFELSVDGEPFYRGTSSFGFFTKEDLASQAGMDQGQHKPTWLQEGAYDATKAISFKLDSLFGRMKLYKAANPANPQLHLAQDQLNLLDQATVVREGGKYGKGYIWARKEVKAWEWFFTCHFYQDSVMPGSLGVEAILQAMQVYALQQGLADGLQGARFQHPAPNKTQWKYRGQILQHDPEMQVEAHIKEVRQEGGRLVVVADASLWKGSLRIYEVTDLALCIGR